MYLIFNQLAKSPQSYSDRRGMRINLLYIHIPVFYFLRLFNLMYLSFKLIE